MQVNALASQTKREEKEKKNVESYFVKDGGTDVEAKSE